jgi:hypothetical protein
VAGEQDRPGSVPGISYRQLAEGDARLFRLLGLHPGPDFDVLAAAAPTGTEADAAQPVVGCATSVTCSPSRKPRWPPPATLAGGGGGHA